MGWILVGAICLAVPFAVGSFLYYVSLKGKYYEMDWGDRPESAYSSLKNYYRIFWSIFWLGLVGMSYFSRFDDTELGLIYLAASVYALLFIGWMTYCYETYLHSKHPNGQARVGTWPAGTSNYTGGRYAVTFAFAISSIFLFVAALLFSIPSLAELR